MESLFRVTDKPLFTPGQIAGELSICYHFYYIDASRRRLYDVLHVFDAIGLVFRQGRGDYQWLGLKNIGPTIEKYSHINVYMSYKLIINRLI